MKTSYPLLLVMLFACLLAAWPLSAQNNNNATISGTISDATTGEELIGAAVLVKEMPNAGALTNAYGFFSLTLPKGTYTLSVRYVSYADTSITVQLDSNRQITFKVFPASKQLNQVEITANKNETVTKAQMGSIKMDVKEMEKIPVIFGEKDLLKTLQLLPGVKSAGEGSSGFYVRGGGADQNLILLDEAPVYNASHLLGFFSTFNSDAIKDVTLYKGNMPAEFGGRLSSTVDIKMKDGNNKNYVIGGGLGLISSRLYVEGPIVKDRGSFIITGRRTYADLFVKLAPNKNARNSILYFYDINAKGNYRINDKNRIFISGYFGRDKLGIKNTNQSFGLTYGNITGTLRWNHIFSDKLFSNTTFVVNDFDYLININTSAFNFDVRSLLIDYNLKEDLQYYINSKHALKFGLISTYHTIVPGSISSKDTSNLDQFSLTKKYGWENSVYIQHEWKPIKQIEMNYGIRFTTFSVTGPGRFNNFDNYGNTLDTFNIKVGKIGKTYFIPEPRFTISYNFIPNHSFKLAYSRNSQSIHQLSNSAIGFPTDIWVLSSNNIKPQIADQVSLGYYVSFWKNHFEASVEGYYKHMYNQIDYRNGAELVANEEVEGDLLYGTGRAYGAEFYLKMNVWKMSGWISYTLARSERLIPGVNFDKYYSAKQDRTHDLSIVLIYQIIPRLSVSATFVYYTGNAVTFPQGKYITNGSIQAYYGDRNGDRMPAYHRLDIGLTYELKTRKNYEHSLAFSIYNLYYRKNAYIIGFGTSEDDPTKPAITKTYLFPIVPSLTYNFKFTVPQPKKKVKNG